MRRAWRPAAGTWRRRCAVLACAVWLGLGAVLDAAAVELTAWAGAIGGVPSAPWRFAGLPQQKLPATAFALEVLEGQRVLRVEANGSYGNLVHPLNGAKAGELSWRWRVERPLQGTDLKTRQGDDVALKVCALFDMPRERVPFFERQLMGLAESRAGEALPNATLCYVWDPAWPEGSVLPNVYSRRVRYVTLGAPGRAWQLVRRNLAGDFLRAFGDEAQGVPGLLAIGVGADADNTGGSSLAWIGDLEMRDTTNP